MGQCAGRRPPVLGLHRHQSAAPRHPSARYRRQTDRPFRLLSPRAPRHAVARGGGLVGGLGSTWLRQHRWSQRRLEVVARDVSYSAASRPWRLLTVRIVTSSSDAVGCTAMVASRSALVAPIFTAIPTSWIISPASGATMWQPSTRSVAPSTTSLSNTVMSRPDSVAFSGRNIVL